MDKHLSLSGSQVAQLRSEKARLNGFEVIHPFSDILKFLKPFFPPRNKNDHISHLQWPQKHLSTIRELLSQAAKIERCKFLSIRNTPLPPIGQTADH